MELMTKEECETFRKRIEIEIDIPQGVKDIVPIILGQSNNMRERAVCATQMLDWIRYMDSVIWQFDNDFREWRKEKYEDSADN